MATRITSGDDDRLVPILERITDSWRGRQVTDLDLAAACMDLLRHPDIAVDCRAALGRWIPAEGVSAA